jgi:hypothetical protein
VIDMFTNNVVTEVDHEHSFAVSLEPHQGMSLLTVRPPPEADHSGGGWPHARS